MNKATFVRGVDGKTITVTREYHASKSKVWEAWTNSAMLEKWWAPEPYKAVTKTFEFKEGGGWLYYMLGPDESKTYCWMGYDTIKPEESFAGLDAFCDKEGNVSKDMPRMHWKTEFHDTDGKTKVLVTITFENAADLQKIVEMGFEEGFTMGLNQLEKLLEG
jgi:uncharacterized protein YndB with AHSA1/START domain